MILGFVVGNAAIGAYEVAWRISLLFVLLPQALNSILHVAISSRTTEGNPEGAKASLEKGLRFATGLAIPGTVGALLLGNEILALYGESVTAVGNSYVVLVVLCGARMAEAFEILLGGALSAIGHPEREFRVSGLFLGTNVLLNLVLVPSYGIVGAASATAASVAVASAYAWTLFPDWFDVSFPARTIGAQFAAAILMGGAVFAMISHQPPTAIALTIGYVVVGAFVYGGSLLALSSQARLQARQVVLEVRELI